MIYAWTAISARPEARAPTIPVHFLETETRDETRKETETMEETSEATKRQ